MRDPERVGVLIGRLAKIDRPAVIGLDKSDAERAAKCGRRDPVRDHGTKIVEPRHDAALADRTLRPRWARVVSLLNHDEV
jgi:hypothetical protein